MITIRQEIWGDAEGNPVPFGDPSGVAVLFGEGVEIHDEIAKQYGILSNGKFVGAEQKALKAPPQNKAMKAPPENK